MYFFYFLKSNIRHCLACKNQRCFVFLKFKERGNDDLDAILSIKLTNKLKTFLSIWAFSPPPLLLQYWTTKLYVKALKAQLFFS